MSNKELNVRNGRPSVVVQACKILQARGDNFARVPDANEFRYMTERPMMLSMWTQTYAQDFQYLGAQQPELKLENTKKCETERMLLEKIRYLEETVRAHADLLEQMYNTNGRQNTNSQQYQQYGNNNISPQYNYQSPIEQDDHEQEQQQQHRTYKTQDHTPRQSPTSSVPLELPTTAVMKTAMPVYAPPITESIKYTIIAEGNSSENGAPIEIKLAPSEDDNVHLNTSAESDRLEICFEPATPETSEIEHTASRNITLMNADKNLPKKRRRIKHELEENIENMPDKLPATYVHNKNNSFNLKPLKEQQHTQLVSTPKRTNYILNDSNMGTAPEQKIDLDKVMVSIGPNNTRIPAKLYENMDWKSASIATRKLLMAVFDRHTLATHSMTGKPSPAFKDHGKPMKEMLDPLVIQDIIFAVTRKCNVTDKQVRTAITTKCADENKMMKMQINKRRSLAMNFEVNDFSVNL